MTFALALSLCLIFLLFSSMYSIELKSVHSQLRQKSDRKMLLQRKTFPKIVIAKPQFSSVIATNKIKDVKSMSSTRACLYLFACTVLYGSSYIVTKHLQTVVQPPEMINVIRFFVASLLFLPSLLLQHASINTLLNGMELGVLCSIGFISQSLALQSTSTNKVAFFVGLSVIMPPIFDSVVSLCKLLAACVNEDCKTLVPMFLRRQAKLQIDKMKSPTSTAVKMKQFVLSVLKSGYVAPLLAIAGGMVLEFGSHSEPARLSDLLLIVTPISFALCFYRSSIHATRKHNENKTMYITGTMVLTTAVMTSLYAYACGQLPNSVVDWKATMGSLLGDYKATIMLLYLGVICTAWTAYIEQKALTVLSAAETSLIYSSEPIFATLFGFLFLNEQITLNIIIGSMFIVGGCLYNTVINVIL